MKKVIFLILSVMICLSMSACGNDDQNIIPQDSSDGNISSDGSSESETQNPMLQYIYGKWYLFESDCEAAALVVTVKNDGTCIMGTEELTWKYSHTDHYDLLWINVFEGEVCKYKFAFDGEPPQETMSLGISSAEGSYLCGYLPNPTPIANAIFGEWNMTYVVRGDKESIPAKVIIREDGSCSIGSNDYSWVIYDSQESSMDLLITSGTLQYHIYLQNTNDDQVTMELYMDNWGANYLNQKFYQTIELTPENWRDYFELVIKPKYEKNAFGDVQQLVLTQYIVLKEEYAEKILYQNLFAEIEATAKRHYITLDVATESYTLGEAIEEILLTPQINGLYSSDGTYKIEIFGNNYINASDNADPNSDMSKKVTLVSNIEDVNFLRVTGELRIKNN